MAKKKSTPQTESKPPKPQDQIQNHHNQSMDDAASEKLDSLKSLNALLLKETVERRQQVDSLVQSKAALESELNRSAMEKLEIESKVEVLTDREVMLEIENGLVSVFVAVQVDELVEVSGNARVLMEERIRVLEEEKRESERERGAMESETESLKSRLDAVVAEIDEEKAVSSRVCEERDELRAQLDARIREEAGLRLKLSEVEKREAEILEEVGKLKADYDSLVEEKAVNERRMDLILREKDLVERNLVESNGVVDELKRDIEEIVKEMKLIEEEKSMQERNNEKLQISVCKVNVVVDSLKKEEEALLEKVADLEKRCVESTKKEVEMRRQIVGLVEERKVGEGNVQRLADEKGLVMKDLEETREMLEHQKLTIVQMAQEKTEIEDAKSRDEKDIVLLKEQLGEFKDTILSLEKSSIAQMDELKKLEAEVSRHKAAFDQATIERNEARESLEEEKIIGNNLREKLSKLEKEVKEVRDELMKLIGENDKLALEKDELGNRCLVLVKDITLVEKKLWSTQKEFDDLKAKLGLAEANSKMVLNILKNTSMICQSKEDDNAVVDQETGFAEKIKDHVTEMEAIKRAFKDRESRIEDMTRQLESLKNSVAKANEGKSFWTLVSSATTLLAAVSFAYVARGH